MMEQRSPEWRRARIGIPTASNFDKIVTKSGAPSEQAQSYMCRLIGERLLGRSLEEDISGLKWVMHGRTWEDVAVEKFEAASNEKTELVGFVTSHDGQWGCSPDRLIVGKNAALEVKCPSPWKHIEYRLFGPGRDYRQQVQGQMLVGGYDMVYFFSYFPGMKSAFYEYERDNKFINTLREALIQFSKNIDIQIEKLDECEMVDRKLALDVLSALMPEA